MRRPVSLASFFVLLALLIACLAVAGAAARAHAAETANGVRPKDSSDRPLNLDFEDGTLRDWIAEGEAFEGQPIQGDTVFPRRRDMRSEHQGEYWIGGYERHGDAPLGMLTSAPFEVTHPWATFLVGGGSHGETRVELLLAEDDGVFYEVAGRNQENLRPVVVDLRKLVGQEIFIRLVDTHRGGWGHINFDDFRFHARQPGEPTPQLVRAVPQGVSAPLSPEEAVAAMTLPEGFSVVVSAGEPDVQQPIAMALDERGRVWVAEAYEYPRRAPEGQGRDRILIFEDTTGDGKLDKRTVFAEGLNLVSGLEVGYGGVWVGAAPYLLFIPDRDGDDVPDGEPQTLLDGWGFEDTHETLNSFIWGPDGWLYGCHGIFTHSRVGKPGTPDDERTPLNAAIWRYHPVRHEFEVFAHGTSNPWGVDFNEHGQAVMTACVIPHLYHVIQGGRYQRQAGAHFNGHTYDDIKTIADHLHYEGDIREHAHWGHEPAVPEHVAAAGGGHAHAGAMIYLGGTWPEEYRDKIFMNNIHGARVNMDVLVPRGSGYVGSHGADFLIANDPSSQILNFRYGPDGNVYFIDWYDANQCHRNEIETHDRSNGRIYKIVYGEPKAVRVDLQERTNLELAELMLHENDWYVRHARRILQERAAAPGADLSQARNRLAEIATTHADATRRLRGMWALHVTGGLPGQQVDRLLADANPYVRGWTVQLALDGAEAVSEGLLSRFARMAREDESQVVRLYLAAAAQRLPLENRWSLLEGLASHSADAADHNLPLMVWYAAEPLADVNAERALAFGLSAGENIPLLREFMLRRIGSADTGKSLALLVRGLDKADDPQLQRTYLRGIQSALAGQRRVAPPDEWAAVFDKLRRSGNPTVQMQALALGVTFGDSTAVERMRGLAADPAAGASRRRVAIESLLAAGDRQLVSTLQNLLDDPELRDVAIRGLAQYDHPETPSLLLSRYPNLSPAEKRSALATLSSRPAYAAELLRAIERKDIAGTDLTADLVRQLDYLKSDEVTALLKDVWGSVRATAADKAALIGEYKAMLAVPAASEPDASLGRAVFARTCQQCHILYSVGEKIGPDLTGSNRGDLDYLLSNIVDPSAVMAKEYQPSVFYMVTGRVITGIVRAEDDNSVTVQTANETLVLPKDEIDESFLSQQSMMPDDQLKQFSEQEIRSLVAYLQTRRQVPLLATADNASLLFNGRTLDGWSGDRTLWSVEDGQIVGRSSGLDHNAFLTSEMAVEDFRLELEVKLVDNAGNSGIQFRSEALPKGEVAGYQADIGAGWWGKLYEEHGRALLWDKSGEQHVREGDWNKYVIEAKGPHIRTWINGQRCVDLNDLEGARRGILALQLHSGGPTEVRFRNIKLEIR